jgi:hypothetical protein
MICIFYITSCNSNKLIDQYTCQFYFYLVTFWSLCLFSPLGEIFTIYVHIYTISYKCMLNFSYSRGLFKAIPIPLKDRKIITPPFTHKTTFLQIGISKYFIQSLYKRWWWTNMWLNYKEIWLSEKNNSDF